MAPHPPTTTSAGAKKKLSASSSAAAATAGTSVSMSSKKPEAAASDSATASGELFARSVALMAAAHVARGAGFDALQRSAGDALVEILAKYIQRVGGAAKDIAEHAGRTQPRATDVMLALSDMLPAPVELPDLVKALETAKRPFPRDVPAFPARKRDLGGSALEQSKQIGSRDALPPHVPGFLPPLPNRHTYSAESRVVVEREQDTKRARLELLGQKSHIQQSLHGLQSVFAKKPVEMVLQPSWNAFQGAATAESASENPFVQPPLVGAVDPAASLANSVFAKPERSFVPAVGAASKGQKKNAMENSSVTLPKLSNNQELGKEEKILTGTFHDGDSE